MDTKKETVKSAPKKAEAKSIFMLSNIKSHPMPQIHHRI